MRGVRKPARRIPRGGELYGFDKSGAQERHVVPF